MSTVGPETQWPLLLRALAGLQGSREEQGAEIQRHWRSVHCKLSDATMVWQYSNQGQTIEPSTCCFSEHFAVFIQLGKCTLHSLKHRLWNWLHFQLLLEERSPWLHLLLGKEKTRYGRAAAIEPSCEDGAVHIHKDPPPPHQTIVSLKRSSESGCVLTHSGGNDKIMPGATSSASANQDDYQSSNPFSFFTKHCTLPWFI